MNQLFKDKIKISKIKTQNLKIKIIIMNLKKFMKNNNIFPNLI